MTIRIRGQRVIPMNERLLSFVKKDDLSGCWNWTGASRAPDNPYGRLMIGSRTDGTRRSIGAHQMAYITWKGEIPKGMCVCHRCDNPRCINPGHLFLGTKKDNSDDRDRKGRNKPAPRYEGFSAPWRKVDERMAAEILSSKDSSRKIAARFGISDGHVRALRRGECIPAPPIPGEA